MTLPTLMTRVLFYLAVTFVSLIVVLFATVVVLDLTSGYWLHKPLSWVATRQSGQEVQIAKAQTHILSLTPGIELTTVNARGTRDDVKEPLIVADAIGAAVRLSALLRGHVVLSYVGLDKANIHLSRTAEGASNWSSGTPKTEEPATPLKLPVIEYLYVRDSRIHVDDAPSNLRFEGQFATEERREPTGGQPFTLEGNGKLNGKTFGLDLKGGAVNELIQAQGYPFNLHLSHGATKLAAEGRFTGLSGEQLEAKVTLSGANLADLYDVTRLALPETRAYTLTGQVSRDGDLYVVKGLQGKVGASDLNGDVRVDVSGAKPMLTANLHSRSLNPEDAGVVFGGSEALDGKTRYLLPATPLALDKMKSLDARVRYRAAALQVDTLPLKDVSLSMVLDNGTLDMQPIAITLPQGTLTGRLLLDASASVPHIAMDIRVSRAQLNDFATQAGVADAISGTLSGRLQMAGSGTSFHEAAGNSDGRLALTVTNGSIRQTFAELAGVNVLKGLGLLFTGSTKQIPLTCGVADFPLKNGVMTAKTLVVGTDVVRVDGRGTLNLADERLDLTLQGRPLQLSAVRLLAPVYVRGTLLEPDVGLVKTPLIVQAGAAAALGVVLTPLASLLAFVDTGIADDVNCQQLLRNQP